MLSLKNIVKTYRTGDAVVQALAGVSIDFRAHEFVSVLGPSGCGKTTLLNVIGGLDRYDSGDLVIRGRSTKEYRPADWDTYRNHSVGFVFQSYNLISHQTVLANVELALTLSGVSREERRRRAAEALEKVGLGDQLRKKPNQMSGGQMQRVAIARALVNDPDILLADEPTGALDSVTSVQIMDLLREVAKEKLVIMVTHNAELAETYSTRIIRLRDGQVQGDSDPFEAPAASETTQTGEIAAGEAAAAALPQKQKRKKGKNGKGKRSMSFLTALSLSLNNLMTKKTRTLLVSFAGSIGIIGIALILALSNGVNLFIASVQEDTLTSYPISVTAEANSLSAMLSAAVTVRSGSGEEPCEHEPRTVYANDAISNLVSAFTNKRRNKLAAFDAFLQEHYEEYKDDLTAVQYSYDMNLQIYHNTEQYGLLRVTPTTMFDDLPAAYANSSYMDDFTIFSEIMPGRDGELINNTVKEQYEIVEGRWPKAADELVLVVDRSSTVTNLTLYMLGLADPAELTAMMMAMLTGESYEANTEDIHFSFDTFLGDEAIRLNLVYNSDLYRKTNETYTVDGNEYPVWTDRREDENFDAATLFAGGKELKFVGIICPAEGVSSTSIQGAIGYTTALTRDVMDTVNQSEIVKQQLAAPTHDVFTGLPFTIDDADTLTDAEKKAKLEAYFTSLDDTARADIYTRIRSALSEDKIAAIMAAVYDALPTPEQRRDFLIDVYGFNSHHGSMAIGTRANSVVAAIAYAVDPDAFTLPQYKVLVTTFADAFGLDGVELTPANDLYNTYAEALAKMYPTAAKADRAFDTMVRSFIPTVNNVIALQDMATEIGFAEYNRITTENDTPEKRRAYLKEYYNSADVLPETAVNDYVDGLSDADLNTEFQTAVGKRIAAALQDEEQMVTLRAGLFDAYLAGLTDAEYAALYEDYMEKSDSTLEENLSLLGATHGRDALTAINIYPVDFAAKERLTGLIDRYNAQVENEDDKIEYTDLVALIMSSVTTIINAISYVLIAFVSISLVVSSIMIGIITYISVLERTKEIGILRAIGASKRDISRVFNAETLIIGFAAGVIGILATLMLCIPINIIVHALSGIKEISAVLPVAGGFLLVGISMVLTLIAGLIPSGIAAKKDPVEALRTE